MSAQAESSLEPYLRARAINPSLIPSNPQRSSPPANVSGSHGRDDFLDFLTRLLNIATLPVRLPLQWIHNLVTSPLTISVIIKLALLFVLTCSSAIFSILATGAFWYSWGTGGEIELEGWLIYGSKSVRVPHTSLPVPMERFQEDLRYDVQVEMELVRPARGAEEMGNFMLSLELRSARDTDLVVFGASQPSLPPPALPQTLIPLPSFPTYLLPPCLIPWPFRSFCPSRLLGYADDSVRRMRRRRAKGSLGNPVGDRNVVLLRKDLIHGVVVNPGRGGEAAVGSAFISIGREDVFNDVAEGGQQCATQPKEVRTTGWVVVRFIPRPYGVRWLLSVHPIPPLLILPPISLALTLASSLFAFILITYIFRPRSSSSTKREKIEQPMSASGLLAEKTSRLAERQERETAEEEERRRREWEEVESSALGGLRKMPDERKRGKVSTVGGSETTAPSRVRSFAPVLETESEVTETSTETGTEDAPTESGID